MLCVRSKREINTNTKSDAIIMKSNSRSDNAININIMVDTKIQVKSQSSTESLY